MFMNSSAVTHFLLTAYGDTGALRPLLFLLVLLFYLLVLASNVLVLLVVWWSSGLHEPMYLLLCSLSANELYGSTGLFPFLLLQLLSDTHWVPLPACFLQIFCLYSYVNVEFCMLAAMSYDRYVAICHPLAYASTVTPCRVATLVAMSWLLPLALIAVLLSLSASLRLCGHVIERLYCGNFSVVKLACTDTRINNIYGLLYTVVSVLVPLAFILFTYIKILAVCFSGSRQTRHKAMSTCSPHLVALLNFSFGVCFQVVQSRFDMRHVPTCIALLMSLYFFTVQPLLTPLIYGLNTTAIRKAGRRTLGGSRGR